MSQFSPALLRLLVLGVSLVFVAIAGELLVRAFAPVEYAGRRARFVPHPHLVYKGNPEHRRINSAGFGDVERKVQKSEGTIRIAAIGGSTTFGIGNWPTQLEALLQAEGLAVEVLNFGMGGWTTQESLINLATHVLDYQPDVVIVHHALNDLMPRLYRNPRGDYSHFRKAFDYDPPAILRRSHLYAFVRERIFGEPSLANTTMTVNDPPPDHPYRPGELSGDGSVFARNLRSLVAVAEAGGIEVVLTTMPTSLDPKRLPVEWSIEYDTKIAGMQQHNEIVRLVAGESGLPLVDIEPEMSGREDLYLDHIHCNERGNVRKAELIAGTPAFRALLERLSRTP